MALRYRLAILSIDSVCSDSRCTPVVFFRSLSSVKSLDVRGFRRVLSMPFCRNYVTVAIFIRPAGGPASQFGATCGNGN